MKLKINKSELNFIIIGAWLIASLVFPGIAETSDPEQSMHITSDIQSIDMKKNIVTFTGKVTITQGTLKINADKVVITHVEKEKGEKIIDGYGNPASFYQIQEKGQVIKGHALHMHYELPKELLILTGNAYLEKLDSNITSEKLSYLIKERKMQAYSQQGKRVTTVLVPSKL